MGSSINYVMRRPTTHFWNRYDDWPPILIFAMTSYCKALWGQNDGQRRTTDRWCPEMPAARPAVIVSLCKGCRWCYIFWLLLVPVVIVIGAMVVVVLLSAACFIFNGGTSRVWQSSCINFWISRFGEGKREFSKWRLPAKFTKQYWFSVTFLASFKRLFMLTLLSLLFAAEIRKKRLRSVDRELCPKKLFSRQNSIFKTNKTSLNFKNVGQAPPPSSSTQQHAALLLLRRNLINRSLLFN